MAILKAAEIPTFHSLSRSEGTVGHPLSPCAAPDPLPGALHLCTRDICTLWGSRQPGGCQQCAF